MRAVVYTESGDTSVLELVERAVPDPGPGEVRVRTAGQAARRATVDAVGPDVTDLSVGDRVWTMLAQHQRPGGTAQEQVVIPAERVTVLPDSVSYDVGASLGVPAVTAHRALTTSEDGPDRLAPGALAGMTVLVAGGAGAATRRPRWRRRRARTTSSTTARATPLLPSGRSRPTGSTWSSRSPPPRTSSSTSPSSSRAAPSRSTPTTAATR